MTHYIDMLVDAVDDLVALEIERSIMQCLSLRSLAGLVEEAAADGLLTPGVRAAVRRRKAHLLASTTRGIPVLSPAEIDDDGLDDGMSLGCGIDARCPAAWAAATSDFAEIDA